MKIDLAKSELLNTSLLVRVGYVLFSVLLAKLILWGLKEPFYLSTTIAVALFLIFFTTSRLSFWCIVFPLSLLAGLYAPVSQVYGYPNYQALISLLATNKTEVLDFLGLIPAKLYLKSASVPLLAIATHLLARYSGLKLWRNKTFVLVTIAVMIVAQPPNKFYAHVKKTFLDYYSVENYSPASTWPPSKIVSVAKDYILIIGESVRRDYLHIYGYPINNTPFLNRVDGVIVNGLSAGGIYTVGSLANMLTDGSNWVPRYDRTIIDLAKNAGFEISWITNNQGGLVDSWNTPITAIAAKADKTIRIKANMNDFMLLDIMDEILGEKTDKPRLIVLHTRGSHYDACKRFSDMPSKYLVSDSYYDYIACYISSIKQTDHFIERIYNTLERQRELTGRQFSIVYFADHGETHYKKDGKLILNHLINSKKQSRFIYDIPLVKIDSMQQKRKVFNSKKSGLRFTEGLANWMGISNPDIGDYDLFDGKNDPNDFGLSINTKNFIVDPAIDITPFLQLQ